MRENELRPIPEYLKNIKKSIRGFKGNRESLECEIKRIKSKYEQEIESLVLDLKEYYDRQLFNKFNSRMQRDIEKVCESYGKDTKIYIIYNDGTSCIVYGEEIVTRESTPKMQHIAYAMYSDGWTEYDTFTGILVDEDTCIFGDLSTDEGIKTREAYYNMINKIFLKEI